MSRFASVLAIFSICLSIFVLTLVLLFETSPLIQIEEGGTRWKFVKKFGGSGNQETSSFHVSSNEWKIVWSFRGRGEIAVEILSFNAKEVLDLFQEEEVWNVIKEGEFRLHSGQASFLLRIQSQVSWNFTIFEWS